MKFVIQRVKNASVEIEGKLHSRIGAGLLVFFCAEAGDEKGGEYGGKKLDSAGVLEYFVNKILKLRIFEEDFLDEIQSGLQSAEEAQNSRKSGKMNRSVMDIGGEILVVSQFTLAANCKKGTRPSFDAAMEPVAAKKMYEDFVLKLHATAKKLAEERSADENPAKEENPAKKENNSIYGLKTIQTGVFAADMQISLLNDGPVTILM